MTPQEQSFIMRCGPAALASEKATGVPKEITLAQAILESGWGVTTLSVECNNLFGIKADAAEISSHHYHEFNTREQEANGQMEIVRADFATFASLEDCFVAHAALLSNPHYAAAMAVKGNLSEFAYMLGPKTKQHPMACGYSTLIEYHDRLMQLISLYQLSNAKWFPALSAAGE